MTETPDKKSQRIYCRRRLIAGLSIVIVAIGGTVALANYLPKRKDEKPKSVREDLPVKVVRISPLASFSDDMILPGTAEPDVVMTVSAEVSGKIESIDCKEGLSCKKGDVMIRINTDLLEPQLKRAEAERDLEKYDLDSVTELHARGAATDFALQQAKARVAAAQATVNAAKAQLDRASVAAPVGGFLNRLLVEEGEYMTPGQAVAEIVDTRKMRILVDVPERDTPYVKLGSKSTILLNLRGEGQSLTGVVDYVSKIADAASRTTRVEILTDNSSGILHSGKIVQVQLQRRVLKDIIMIPLAAVIPMEKLWAVYVVDKDSTAQRRIVDLGFFSGQSVLVLPTPKDAAAEATTQPAELQGLQEGDRLIVEGNRLVSSGQKVRVVKSTGAVEKTSVSAAKGPGK